MRAEDTRIMTSGVFRCCVATVATELLNSDFELGRKSACMHCKRKFELKDSSVKDKEVGILGIWLPIEHKNQCDGCRRGLPIDDNRIHRDDGRPYMVCESRKYPSA